MLLLARKPKEQIRIGDGITISILQVKGNLVRIGVEAPREVHILRGELSPRTTVPADVIQPLATKSSPPVACPTRSAALGGCGSAARTLGARIQRRMNARKLAASP